MNHQARRSVKAPQSFRLRGLYRDLSICYETLCDARDHLSSVRERAVAAVLEEDLECLVQECEDYLIFTSEVSASQLRSFENRSLTVLEEMHELPFFRSQ